MIEATFPRRLAALLFAVLLTPSPSPAFADDPPEPRPASIRTFPRPETLTALLALSDEDIDLAYAALLVEQDLFSRLDARAAVASVDRIARSLAPRLATVDGPERKLRAVSRHLYVRQRFRVDATRTSGRAHSFYATLRRRAGVCYGLSILHAAVCQRLRLPVKIAELPGHVLARFDDGERTRNIETTQRGRRLPDRHYLERYGLSDARYFRTLSNREAVALFLLQTGGALYEVNRSRSGRDAFRRSLELDPKSARGWYKMGLIHEANGAHADELRCFARSLELRPDDPMVWAARGAALSEAGEDEGAEASYRRMLAIDARSMEVWFLAGSGLLREGHREPAARCYEKAIALAPDRRRDHRERRARFVREARPADPDAERLLSLAWLLFSLERHGELRTVLATAQRRHGPECRDALRRYRRHLLRRGSADAREWRFAGLALGRFGDPEAAADCISKANALGRVLEGR
jgi:tetratricopeptide (TPR) repeat protein